jgi:glycosyltransferase involved in cell wall biosynthesis
MRVAILLEQCLSPVPGGTGRYSRELARALAAGAGAGDTVTGWTAWHRDVEAASVEGVAGPVRLAVPRRPLVAAWQAGRGPRPVDADVVHAPTLMAPPRGRRPLVVTIHDAVPWTHPSTLTARGVEWHKSMAARVARTADAVVVPTQAVADVLADLLPLGDKVHVIGEGVSPGLQLPDDADVRAKALDLPPDGYLFSVATVEPRKGLDVVIEALALPDAPDLPLLVAGQAGWGGVDPLAHAASMGLVQDRVRVLGRVSDADLAVLLARATAVVVPSRAEGFGLPLLEAMAAGAPVVTSDDPALVEVGGGAAMVVPVGDAAALASALAMVAADSARRAAMSAAGVERAAAYTWAGAAAATWKLYSSLLC